MALNVPHPVGLGIQEKVTPSPDATQPQEVVTASDSAVSGSR